MPLPAAKDGFSLADFKVARAIGSIYKGASMAKIRLDQTASVPESIAETTRTGGRA